MITMTTQETEVTVFKVFQPEGKKPFKLIGTDRGAYMAWDKFPMLEDIKPKMRALLSVRQEKDYNGQKQYTILKVISVTNPAYPQTETKLGANIGGVATTPTSTEPLLPLFDPEKNHDKAYALVVKKWGEGIAQSDAGVHLTTELCRQGFELWLQLRKENYWGEKV
jgi:hypothetical protein